MSEGLTSSKVPSAAEALEPKDAFEVRIYEEVEEFLRDLTVEFPFPEIFETMRRHEFRDRFGSNVTPLPRKRCNTQEIKEIDERIGDFLTHLHLDFGENYKDFIQRSFRYYTETTVEET